MADGILGLFKKAITAKLTGSTSASSELEQAFSDTSLRYSDADAPEAPLIPDRTPPISQAQAHRRALGLERYSTELQVVFVQYDRKKYAGALERLLALLERLTVDYRVLVVDNADQGSWLHPVSDRVTHVGGDNSGWEFSAFDRGLDLLDQWGCRAKAYALVTDAYTAYGSDFLRLITRRAIERAIESQACVGWIDAWPQEVGLFGKRYHEWLRTSFIIISHKAMLLARPLCTSIDTEQLFTDDPAAPFKGSAPISEPLRAYLLEWLVGTAPAPALTEGWHSQFELNETTLDLFKSKVCAILREHSFSIRLQEAGVLAFDLRLFRRLEEIGTNWEDCDGAVRQKLAWGLFREPDVRVPALRPRSHLDSCELPSTLVHGDDARVCVSGWVLSSRPPQFVQVRLSSGEVLHAPCDLERGDVRETYSAYPEQRPGFRLEGAFSGLPPGSYEVTLCFDHNELKRTLGTITVLQKRELFLHRVLIPNSWPEGRQVPIAIDADFQGSLRAVSVEVLLDGEHQNIAVALDPGVQNEVGLWTHHITSGGHFNPMASTGPHELVLRVNLSDGTAVVHRVPVRVQPTVVSATIHRLGFGPYDPEKGLSSINVDLELFDARPGDDLVIVRDDLDILEVPINKVSDDETSRARLTIDRTVSTVPPGLGNFAIRVRRGSNRFSVWEGSYLVCYERPELALEALDACVAPATEKLKHQLHLRGWVRNHFLVDCLLLEINGIRAGVVGLSDLRPDVAEALNQSLIGRQGFEMTLTVEDIPPGEHVVHIIAVQSGKERVRVSRRVFFEDAPARRMNVVSDDLERLIRGTRKNFYSSISIQGELHSDSESLVAALLVNDRLVDEQVFSEPGSHVFHLRAVPERSGEYSVRFVISARGRLVFSTTPFQVNFQRLEFPRRMSRILGEFIERLDLRSVMVGRQSDTELLNRLIELQPERVPDYLSMIDALGERLSHETTNLSNIIVPPEPDEKRSLRVLVVSWETPSRFHGGGVYLTNLLKGLAAKHEITLVHTAGVDEFGHIEPLRPHLRKIITVPRTFQPAAFRGSALLPRHLYDVYIPELRRVVELEVAAGDYDLVDYEYSLLAPYVVEGPPSLLCVHEMGYTAILNSSFVQARAVEDALPDLDRLLRMFHFNTQELPRLTKHLMTLSQEDAEAAARFSPEVTWFTNPTGVDIAHFGESDLIGRGLDEIDAGSSETFIYVGNFQHPPNVRAALFFAEQVMPLLRLQHPRAEFCLIGSKAPPEVRDLDGQNGVRIVGFVDDLRPWMARAAAYVCPIFSGTGMRVKVLEALASGTPVIASDLSMRGLPVVPEEHYLRANSVQEFLRAAHRAISQRSEVREIAKRGRDLAIANYSWESTVRRRDAIWHHVTRHAQVSQIAPNAGQDDDERGALVG